MCTAFSNIPNLNKAKRDPEVVEAEINKAQVHFAWSCKLYQKQMDRGDMFSMSWQEPEIKNILRQEGVEKVVADQCQLGQQPDNGDPLKKPTAFMSNARHLFKALDKRCFGKHGLCTRPQ